MNFMRRNWKCY